MFCAGPCGSSVYPLTFSASVIKQWFYFLQLESLSKDDLVKFVKRQTVILQKLKAKNTGNFQKFAENEFHIISEFFRKWKRYPGFQFF